MSEQHRMAGVHSWRRSLHAAMTPPNVVRSARGLVLSQLPGVGPLPAGAGRICVAVGIARHVHVPRDVHPGGRLPDGVHRLVGHVHTAGTP